MELVSRNVRGAVLTLSPYVSPFDACMSWVRYGFLNRDYPEPNELMHNPNLYDSFEIGSAYSRQVDWRDSEEASRGLRALTQFVRYAKCEDFDDERSFRLLLEDLENACREDGFEFIENPPTISQSRGISISEMNLSEISTVSGIQRKVKKLNRALVQEKDNLEVISYSKDLMEAVAGAVLMELNVPEQQVRDMQAVERCNKALSELGVTNKNGVGKVAEGLTSLRKGLNKIAEGVTEMRREDTDEGHGMPTERFVTDTQANLAVSGALLWCNFLLDKYHELNPPF